jgi:hypothetical protein
LFLFAHGIDLLCRAILTYPYYSVIASGTHSSFHLFTFFIVTASLTFIAWAIVTIVLRDIGDDDEAGMHDFPCGNGPCDGYPG